MSKEPRSRALPDRARSLLSNIGSGVVVVALLVGGFWGSHYFAPGEDAHVEPDESTTEVAGETEVKTQLILPAEKVASASIQTTQVKLDEIRDGKTVSATVEYDAARRVTIKAPVDCVVEKWNVTSGQVVKEGDVLGVFSGTDIAMARANIKKCEADVRVARVEFDWNQKTEYNLRSLITRLQKNPSMKEIDRDFDGKMLGEHRDHLLRTYTKFVLTNNIVNRTTPLKTQGIVAGSKAEARQGDFDVAATEFKSAVEQSGFDAKQALEKANAAMQLAEQDLSVAKEKLRLLLGPLADVSSDQEAGRFEILAPFAGRVQQLTTSPASRLAQGDEILRFADTTTLWVSALIHQHDWNVLQVKSGELVDVTFPALPNETLKAKVRFTGPQVSAKTRAISVVAELPNDDGRLRPGMFAWVNLPTEPSRSAMVVPTGTVQRHESNAFVFLAEGNNKFRRLDVVTGLETAEQIEIIKGLSVGQEIVDRGAFYLKSELLLEQEAE